MTTTGARPTYPHAESVEMHTEHAHLRPQAGELHRVSDEQGANDVRQRSRCRTNGEMQKAIHRASRETQ